MMLAKTVARTVGSFGAARPRLVCPGEQDDVAPLPTKAASRRLMAACVLITGISVWLCYGFALRLPFYFDDLPIISWLDNRPMSAVWLGQDGGYYRPLPYMIYKLGLSLPYGLRQAALHMANLLLLWLSAILLGSILWRLELNPLQAIMGSLLLVFYPLSIQAIPWVTAMPHPLAVALCLLSVWAALRASCGEGWGWYAVALGSMLLAPLAHESGAVAGVLVFCALAARHGIRWRKLAPALVGITFNMATVLARSQFAEITPATSLPGWQDLYPNLIFFVQGLLYPLGPGIRIVTRDYGWHDLTSYAITLLIVLPIALSLAIKARKLRLMGFGLAWWLLGALPAAVGLPYSSLYISSRVYALSAVGTVIFWASLIASLAALYSRKRVQQLITLALSAVILVQSYTYLLHVRSLYDMLNHIYGELGAVAYAHTSDARLGFVNVPRGLMWEDRTYALTTDDVLFVPPYSNLTEWVTVNRGYRNIDAVTVSAIAEQTDPTWLTQGPWLDPATFREWALERDDLWVVRYDRDAEQFTLEPIGALRPPEDCEGTRPLATFEAGPLLNSATIESMADGRWQLILDWSARSPVEATIFVHVVDEHGVLVTQADGYALGGALPPAFWQPGDQVHDIRTLALPEEAGQALSVYVGLYQGDRRFPVRVAGEGAQGDAVLIGQITP